MPDANKKSALLAGSRFSVQDNARVERLREQARNSRDVIAAIDAGQTHHETQGSGPERNVTTVRRAYHEQMAKLLEEAADAIESPM